MGIRKLNPNIRFITDDVESGGSEDIIETEEIEIEEDENPEDKVIKKEAPKEKEPEVEEPKFDENKQIIFDQAGFDKVIAARVKAERAKTAALEAQVEELMADKHEALLNSLAVGGIKKERLVKTGLKGDALREFAAELAEDFASFTGAESRGISLSEAEKRTNTSGVQLSKKTPTNADDALNAIFAGIESYEGE